MHNFECMPRGPSKVNRYTGGSRANSLSDLDQMQVALAAMFLEYALRFQSQSGGDKDADFSQSFAGYGIELLRMFR